MAMKRGIDMGESYIKCTVNDLIGKIIKEIEIDGTGIYMETSDGIILDFVATSGGFSCWDITKESIDDTN